MFNLKAFTCDSYLKHLKCLPLFYVCFLVELKRRTYHLNTLDSTNTLLYKVEVTVDELLKIKRCRPVVVERKCFS